jgi:hypothetical protein
LIPFIQENNTLQNTSFFTNSPENSTTRGNRTDNINNSSFSNGSNMTGKKGRELDAYSELMIEKSMANLVSGGEIQGRILIGVYDQDDQIVTTD